MPFVPKKKCAAEQHWLINFWNCYFDRFLFPMRPLFRKRGANYKTQSATLCLIILYHTNHTLPHKSMSNHNKTRRQGIITSKCRATTEKFHISDWLNGKYANINFEWVTLILIYTSKKIGSKLFASKNQIRFRVYVGGWRERRGFSVAGNCSPDSLLPWLALLYSINTVQMSKKIKLQDKNPKNRIFANLYFYQNILKK